MSDRHMFRLPPVYGRRHPPLAREKRPAKKHKEEIIQIGESHLTDEIQQIMHAMLQPHMDATQLQLDAIHAQLIAIDERLTRVEKRVRRLRHELE